MLISVWISSSFSFCGSVSDEIDSILSARVIVSCAVSKCVASSAGFVDWIAFSRSYRTASTSSATSLSCRSSVLANSSN